MTVEFVDSSELEAKISNIEIDQGAAVCKSDCTLIGKHLNLTRAKRRASRSD